MLINTRMNKIPWTGANFDSNVDVHGAVGGGTAQR